MSVQTQIDRIKSNIANAYAKAQEKGAELPKVQNSANLPAMIETIPSVRTIEVTFDPENSGIAEGIGMAADGIISTIKVTPKSPYLFNHLSIDDTVVSTLPEYTFTVSSDTNIISSMYKPASKPGKNWAVYDLPEKCLEAYIYYNNYRKCFLLFTFSTGGNHLYTSTDAISWNLVGDIPYVSSASFSCISSEVSDVVVIPDTSGVFYSHDLSNWLHHSFSSAFSACGIINGSILCGVSGGSTTGMYTYHTWNIDSSNSNGIYKIGASSFARAVLNECIMFKQSDTAENFLLPFQSIAKTFRNFTYRDAVYIDTPYKSSAAFCVDYQGSKIFIPSAETSPHIMVYDTSTGKFNTSITVPYKIAGTGTETIAIDNTTRTILYIGRTDTNGSHIAYRSIDSGDTWDQYDLNYDFTNYSLKCIGGNSKFIILQKGAASGDHFEKYYISED